MVDAIPTNYPRVSPYLRLAGAAAAIDFYTGVFGFTERGRMPGPDGLIGHAELELGDSLVMLADEMPDNGMVGPGQTGGSGVMISMYVEDVDDVTKRAVDAGATVVSPPSDQFYGDRLAVLQDPFGHMWSLATHVEDVSPEEMERRAAAMGG